MTKRIERVNKLLKEEINKILLKEFDFEKVLVTIIDVETAPNLSYADIKISVMPDDKEEQILKILESQIHSIQKALNKKLNMRPIPRIRFKIDKDLKKLHKIDEILEKLNQ